MIRYQNRALVAALVAIIFPNFVSPSVAAETTCKIEVPAGANLDLCDLRGADLSGFNLAGTSFVGAILAGANLTGADLSNANLSKANLEGADLSGSNLSGANMRKAWLEGAIFSETNLAGVTSGEIAGTPQSTPPYSGIVNGYWIFPHADLTGADFSEANLDDVNFSTMNLTGADFSGAQMISTIFTESILTGANFTDATFKPRSLEGVTSGGITGFKNDYDSCWLSCIFYKGYLVAPRTNLAKANLDGIAVHGNGGSIFQADLTDASLVGANLSGLNLGGVNFSNANLTNATLVGTVVWGNTSFAKTNLTGADLRGLNSREEVIDLSTSILSGVKSGSISSSTILPDTWKLINGYLIGPGANLQGANLSKADLSNANLRDSNLINANLQEANLNGSNFGGANLQGASGENISGEPSVLPPGWVISERSLLEVFHNSPTPSISGVPNVGSTLTANEGVWDAGVMFSYQWLSGSKVVGTAKTLSLTKFDLGQQITLQLQVSKRGYVGEFKTSTSILVKAGTFTKAMAPEISGVVRVGKTLKCVTTGWIPGAKFTYQWHLDGKKIVGAIGSTFKPLPAHKKHKLSVVVTQSSTGYLTKSLSSKLVVVG